MNNLVAPVENGLPQPLWADIDAPTHKRSQTAWLVSFVDLTALMVAFFVLLFSTQTLEREKWDAVAGSFREQFSPRETVVPIVPDGGDNAVVRVTGVKSGLAYLDTLLLQRVAGDSVWGNLQALRENGGIGTELRYELPKAALEGAGTNEAWGRLASAIRGWKNSVGVRVIAPDEEIGRYADKGVSLTEKLQNAGIVTAFTELVVQAGSPARLELVVRSE